MIGPALLESNVDLTIYGVYSFAVMRHVVHIPALLIGRITRPADAFGREKPVRFSINQTKSVSHDCSISG